MSDRTVEQQDQEMGLFFILNLFLSSFQQRDFFDVDEGLQIIDHIHNVMEQWLELHVPHQKRTCMKGCSACCYNNPNGITTFDLWVLYHRDILQLQKHSETLQKNLESYHSLQNTDRETLQISWIKTQTPCPFLENQNCSIYKNRPLACRIHISTFLPKYCHPNHIQFEKIRHRQRTLPEEIYKKFFQTNTHPQDLLGACVWLLEELKRKSQMEQP